MSPPTPEPEDLSLNEFLGVLAPAVWNRRRKPAPSWPPDAFAIAATLLKQSGAYQRLVHAWPPAPFSEDVDGLTRWCEHIAAIGLRWATNWPHGQVPQQVRSWWKVLRDNRHRSLAALDTDDARLLRDSLWQLGAAADEACYGVGVPWSAEDDPREPLWQKAAELLDPSAAHGSTLCEHVRPSRLRVLPKMRTPQAGLTLRSLTHHLALCPSGEVQPDWHINQLDEELHDKTCLNLLLAPWPKTISLQDFRPLPAVVAGRAALPEEFGFFAYARQQPQTDLLEPWTRDLLERARAATGAIDGVVFPELALLPDEFERVRDTVLAKNAFLIAGLQGATPGGFAQNYVECVFPMPGGGRIRVRQTKHHRWCLDRDQIVRYGLAARLDPNRRWWEGIDLEKRRLAFVAIHPWLTLCFLICEDLARPDPVADLIRAVGPNLVIALLMDGPQLDFRWPARCATVLAEDPGSSVLTFSSLGMVLQSRELHKQEVSRVIALWRDARTGSVQVRLPEKAEGVVLNLTRNTTHHEWTADGRFDDGAGSLLVLAGIHPVT